MPRLIAALLGISLALFVLTSVLDMQNSPNQARISQKSGIPSEAKIRPQTNGPGFRELLKSVVSERASLRGEERNQINFLFLGIGGEGHVSGKYLTDTIILVIFAPQSKKTAVISIPRDLLVRSAQSASFTKINALYVQDPLKKGFPGPMGIEFTKKKVAEITGITPDYYAVLDLEGVHEIVDTLGGIYVRRGEDLVDNRFPDDTYGYETYKINEGWRFLNGEGAAKYIRTRHTAGGDFDRMKRQQEVARAIRKKMEGLQSIFGLSKLISLYSTLKNHLAADLTASDITSFFELARNMKEEDVIFNQITAGPNGLLIYDKIELGGVPASILKPRAGLENYEEVKKKIRTIIENLHDEIQNR